MEEFLRQENDNICNNDSKHEEVYVDRVSFEYISDVSYERDSWKEKILRKIGKDLLNNFNNKKILDFYNERTGTVNHELLLNNLDVYLNYLKYDKLITVNKSIMLDKALIDALKKRNIGFNLPILFNSIEDGETLSINNVIRNILYTYETIIEETQKDSNRSSDFKEVESLFKDYIDDLNRKLIEKDEEHKRNLRIEKQILQEEYETKIMKLKLKLEEVNSSSYKILTQNKENITYEENKSEKNKIKSNESSERIIYKETMTHSNNSKKFILEILSKIIKNLKDYEYLIDKRLISSILIKLFDKQSNDKIKKTLLCNLSYLMGFTLDEKKKMGISKTTDTESKNYLTDNNPMEAVNEMVKQLVLYINTEFE